MTPTAHPNPAAPVGPGARAPVGRVSRVLRFLPALTLASVVTVTSTSEWTLARTVLDLPPAVAWAVPVAIDSYVIAALRTRRDVGAAVLVMAGALTAAMGAHLASAARPAGDPLPVEVTAPAAAAIMSVLVIVAWRVHVLIDHLTQPATTPHPTPASTAAGTAPVTASMPTALTAAGTPTGEYSHGPHRTSEYTGAAASAPLAALETAAVVAATPRRTTPGPRTSQASSPGRTDAQILGDLDGASPGVRALKRTYSIGQSRASRIHQQVTDQKTKTEDQQNHQTAAREAIQEPTEGRTRADSKNSHEESARSESQETHPCITDRVGQSRSTQESAAAASEPVLRTFGRA